MNDTELVSQLWKSTPKLATVIIRRNHAELYQQISNVSGGSFSEKCWKFVHAGQDPACEQCHQAVKYLDFRRGFARFCSKKCAASSTTTANKRMETVEARYGETHYSKTAEYRVKFANTCESRYGVKNPGQIEQLIASRARAKQQTFWNQLLEDIQEFTIPKFSFQEYTHVRDKELLWECVQCKREFLSNVFGKLPKCPVCFPSGNTGGPSAVELEVLAEIRRIYSGTIITNDRTIIPPKEIDIYIPEFQLAIELNGIYWHSSDRKDSQYHYNKFLECEKRGISLLMITDYEWQHNRAIIVNMIRHRLHQSPNYPARKCTVIPVSAQQANAFLSQHHMHGYSRASAHLGLYGQDQQLLAVLSYMKKSRFENTCNLIEIVRLGFANRSTGALGKFIKYITREYPACNIVSYADLRYGAGKVYLKNGFELSHTTKPGYWYLFKNQVYHRLSWTKRKLIQMGFDPAETETAIMKRLGAIRFFDCGHRCYILNCAHTD